MSICDHLCYKLQRKYETDAAHETIVTLFK